MNTTKILALGVAAAIAVSSGSAMAKSKGEKLFKKKCGTCHTLEEGKHKVGPSLAGVMGRKAGSTDFGKYKALKGADFAWDEDSIDKWIENPKKFIGKPTAMTVKVKREKERDAIIDFLKGED